MTPGDRPQFSPGIHNPTAQLNDLARRVGQLEGLRVAAPLTLDGTPAGPLISLIGVDRRLMRLDGQETGGSPPANRWGWTEFETLPDGTVQVKIGGQSAPVPVSGDGSQGYAVPIDGADNTPTGQVTTPYNALGIGTYKGTYWEWVPAVTPDDLDAPVIGGGGPSFQNIGVATSTKVAGLSLTAHSAGLYLIGGAVFVQSEGITTGPVFGFWQIDTAAPFGAAQIPGGYESLAYLPDPGGHGVIVPMMFSGMLRVTAPPCTVALYLNTTQLSVGGSVNLGPPSLFLSGPPFLVRL